MSSGGMSKHLVGVTVPWPSREGRKAEEDLASETFSRRNDCHINFDQTRQVLFFSPFFIAEVYDKLLFPRLRLNGWPR